LRSFVFCDSTVRISSSIGRPVRLFDRLAVGGAQAVADRAHAAAVGALPVGLGQAGMCRG